MSQQLDPGTHAAIQEIVERLVAAWNRHDAHAFAASFAPNAEYTNVFGAIARGREEIERMHATIFQTFLSESRWTRADVQMRSVRPDVVTADIRWELVGSRDAQGNEWSPRHGFANFVATRDDGSWSIQVFHNMQLPRDAQ